MASRHNFFHLLTGVWQDGAFGSALWAQIRAQLENDGNLNESERAVLIELIKRMRARPEARRALGFRPQSRTAERNDGIADRYMLLREQGKSPTAAASATVKHFPNVGARAIRGVLESRKIMAGARARALARYLAKTTPTK